MELQQASQIPVGSYNLMKSELEEQVNQVSSGGLTECYNAKNVQNQECEILPVITMDCKKEAHDGRSNCEILFHFIVKLFS